MAAAIGSRSSTSTPWWIGARSRPPISSCSDSPIRRKRLFKCSRPTWSATSCGRRPPPRKRPRPPSPAPASAAPPSVAQQIRELYEHDAAVIEKIGTTQQRSATGRERQRIQVIFVEAVVAHVNRRAGRDQIREKSVEVQL